MPSRRMMRVVNLPTPRAIMEILRCVTSILLPFQER